MTKGMGDFTSVFAMRKAFSANTIAQANTDIIDTNITNASTYSDNFMQKAIYKTPLNPLLVRGEVHERFDDFKLLSAADTINSYEIHKADNTTLTNSKFGINNSYHFHEAQGTTTDGSATQTYSTVNRKYPNSTTTSDHLSNLETTRGNILRSYDYHSNSGQRFITDKTTLSGNEDATDTTIGVASTTGISVNDIIVINNEEMLVTAVSGSLTVIRGFNNTIATSHTSGDKVLLKDNIDSLWVLVYSDNADNHHFAKITEILESEVWGDTIEFSPSLGVDIPKDTKFAVFDSNDSNMPKLDSDNQTLVACGYGLLGTTSNVKHYLNTHASRPFFYFLNGKDKLEPATRYVLRSSSYNGSTHTYTYSTFVTDQEYGTDIIDYGPYTMQASIVDMMYKADNPAAMDFLLIDDDSLELHKNYSSNADKITLNGTSASFDNSKTDLDGTEGTNWGLAGILRDSRFNISDSADSDNDDVYCIDSATDATATTLFLDDTDFGADESSDTDNDLQLKFLSHAVDLDHNKMYCAVDSTNHLKNAFRMAHRPNDDDSNYHSYAIGQTRYMYYTDSPLTNNIAPNAMEMIDYESVTASGGYVDIVFADTQKILAKKIKEGDPLFIHEIIFSEEQGLNRISEIGTFNYFIGDTTLTVDNLTEGQDIRFLLMSPIPDSKTDTGSRDDPLYDGFTVSVSGTLYHIIPDSISNPSSGSQIITPRLWRKATDTEYNTTTLAAGSVPSFNTKGYRRKYSFNADNIMTNIPIDSEINGYSLDYDGSSAAPTKRNLTTFNSLFETNGSSIKVGSSIIEKQEHSRINDINFILRGGSATGHRLHVEYGDKLNKFIKLKTHLKDERFLESYNKTDFLPYSYGMSNVSLYGYPINTESVPVSGSEKRYDLSQNGLTTNNHVRGTLSYLDYFKGVYDIEKRVFSGVVESVEQVVEDGMFKLKVKGRNDVGKLLGPIVNKDYKFTEDIVYSTIGPVERMMMYGSINNSSVGARYEVGTTEIVIAVDSSNQNVAADEGDLLFTTQGVFIGRIYGISGSTFTLEEGIPTALKDDEVIMISSQFANRSGTDLKLDVVPDDILDTSAASETVKQFIRGNTISFAKALSSNPYTTTRVNSLSGTSDKGIIFTGGNSLSLSNEFAPYNDSTTLVGSSSSNHPLAKGYSIHAPDKIDFDLPFYCHLADEITDKFTIDFVNLHTVSSLTDYEIVNLTSKDKETSIEVAPICPVVLARVDNNPLDGRDKYLVSVGNFPDTQPKGYNGIFQFELIGAGTSLEDYIEELKEGDFIFDSSGNLFGKIIDISTGSNAGLANDRVAFTLDRPLFKSVTSSESIYKYYGEASPPQYYSANDFDFDDASGIDKFGGTKYKVGVLTASGTASMAFLSSLSAGMRIHIEGHEKGANNGVFTIGHVFEDDSSDDAHLVFFSRKYESTKFTDSAGGLFEDSSLTDTLRITVLTDYFTQGLYFLNTQGLGQGGVVTLTNPILSSPNAADNIRKPVKWSGGIYHHITDQSVSRDSTGQYSYGSNLLYSDMIDRYGNTKWRYFGLQRGKYLSYINRRRKDGQIKDTYATDKGRVNGYATAYRISDAKFGRNKLMKYPYGYHNNDYAWAVKMVDDSGTIGMLFDNKAASDGDDNLIKTHPYFLEYSSPESRDFRPVMGSNFADFNKHGTTIYSPDETNYNSLIYPRFMPRIHDNFRGGDWQEDTESPLNDSAGNELVYRRWKGEAYDIEWAGTGGANEAPAYVDPAADDSTTFSASLVDRWVKLFGWPDKNNNRTFKLASSFADVSSGNGRLQMDVDTPPFTQIGVSLANSKLGRDVRGSADTTTGDMGISVLYPPWIGPKFDGITRAKDHWELPDPKTQRWFMFSPADMYPDSMARKHHIGYSGTVNSVTVNRKFTDYSLLLKGESSFSNSNTSHEYYEGALEEEQEIDDQYEVLPISSSSTNADGTEYTPSQMKRFGLMRLIDCTYDWHFNLVDPERISDIKNMTTPNFEYTRYQPLVRLNLEITAYGTSDTVVTVDANPSSLLEIGDQIFTDKGKYIGKVIDENTSSSSFTLVEDARRPILKADGTPCLYYGFVYVCGKNTTIATQDWWDSFYQFTTYGRGGENSFLTPTKQKGTNMLQQMWNGYANRRESGTTIHYQIPYGFIDGNTANIQNDPISNITAWGKNVSGLTDHTLTDNITSSTFLEHFNESFMYFAQSASVGSQYVSPIVALPPCFRTFYAHNFTSTNPERTINAMQSKTYLVNRNTGTSSDTNTISSEYSHVSNILEWIQEGGNPYWRCGVVALGRYEVENASKIKTPIGSRISMFPDYRGGATRNFPYSKPARLRTPAADSDEESLQTYGDGFGKITGTFTVSGCTLTHGSSTINCSSSATIRVGHSLASYTRSDGSSGSGIPSGAVVRTITSGTEGVDVTAFTMSNTGGTEVNFIDPDGSGTETSATITFGNEVDFADERSHEFTFIGAQGSLENAGFAALAGDSPEQNTTTGAASPTFYVELEEGKATKNYVADGVFGVFVPNLYLGINSLVGTTALNNSETQEGTVSFTSVAGDGPNNMTREGSLRIEMDVEGSTNYNPFLNFVDLTGMYLVANFGTQVGKKPTRLDFRPFKNDSSVYDISYFADMNSEGTTNAISYFQGQSSMADTMVDPNHIIYVKEHKRNVTGKVVAHELLLDNVPLDNSGAIDFYDNYRIMRPAETCLWRNSPNEIDINCLSSRTTKRPDSDLMYGDTPNLLRINKDQEFLGPDTKNSNYQLQAHTGINEAVMSMYVAIDPDARHAQYLHLGDGSDRVTIALNSNQVTGTNTTFLTDLKEGDVILLDHQKCYVKSIESNTSLTIAGKFANDAALSSSANGWLFNNTYLVLRDYIHLFNPTGNRNTFKSGSPYNMLLTDGLSKQKISMGVEADYYDDRALCKLSIGKIENDMLGIVSFGETFTLKSNKPTKAETYSSAKIGSTIVIGQEVEDVINSLLSSEDIQYDIQDDREYPYYIAPNYQGIDIFNAANFAARYKEKEIRLDEIGISLIKQTNVRDYRPIVLSYDNTNLNIISVTRNKSTFDLYNEIIVYGNGVKTIKRNRKSIEKFGKKTLEDVNMELISQDDVDSRAKTLLKAHSEGDDRFTVKMSKNGIELIRSGDIITLDFPAEGIQSGQYKIYEIRRELMGLVELEVGTYRKDLANRFAELSMLNKSNAASIRGSQFTSTTAPLDFFDTVKLKELRLVIKKISLADPSAFTLGFQTLTERKLDFGTTMAPLDTITTIITDEDLI